MKQTTDFLISGIPLLMSGERAFMAHNVDLPYQQRSWPHLSHTDIIIGPITADTAKKPRNEKELLPGNVIQHAYRSYRFCEQLTTRL